MNTQYCDAVQAPGGISQCLYLSLLLHQVAEDCLLETQKLKAVLEAEADIYESIRRVAEADPTLG